MFDPEEIKNEAGTEPFEPVTEAEAPTDEPKPVSEEKPIWASTGPEERPIWASAEPDGKPIWASTEPEEKPIWASSEPEETPVEESAESAGAEQEPDYADAHYEPAGESTVPPRYYTPHERPAKEPHQRKTKSSSKWLRVACLALVFTLLGGMLGAGLTGRSLNKRIDALEQSLNESVKTVEGLSEKQKELSGLRLASGSVGEEMSAAAIYEAACQQVVGITTNVTKTNLFGMTSSAAVSGSGFIISEDGYIITNYHVIEYAAQGSSQAEVILYDGTKYDARIVGTEQANDVAVLKIDATGLNPVTVGDSDAILVGDTVYPVGNPLGELEFSMSTGHVSALNRVISTQEAEAIRMFQIDAAVNPGNSGGPVYNSRGEVIGVVTAKYSDSDVEGLGFAIPINDVMKIADDLITKGYVTGKAYMGVSLNTEYGVDRYSIAYAQYYNMPVGAYIEEVTHGGAAAKAGLQKGDIITQLGDEPIANYNDLKNALKNYSAGDTAELTFYRAGESRTVSITFDEAVPEGARG